MNKQIYIFPAFVFSYSIFLKYMGNDYYSGGVFLIAVFMWLLIWSNSNKPNKNNGNV